MSFKEDLKCSYCPKVLQDPIILPCQDTICKEHLNESNSKSIQCLTCKEEFNSDNIEFKTNKIAKALLEKDAHLSNEEKILKKSLNDSLAEFYSILDEFKESKLGLSLNIFNHFAEIRRKIDVQREELKQKIDLISLAMIDQTKVMEASYSSQCESFKFDKDLSGLDEDLKKINDVFRDIAKFEESNEKYEQFNKREDISTITVTLGKMNELKEFLDDNRFEADLEMFVNKDYQFGSLILLDFDPFKSQILTSQQCIDLIKLCEFRPSDKWSLLYRASRDGFESKVFQEK